MSDKNHFTAVLTIHATTTGIIPSEQADRYGRAISGPPKKVKTSSEVLKLQLQGDTLADVAAKASNVLGALEGSL